MTLLSMSGISPQELRGQATNCGWEDGHLRAVDDNHGGRREETRVPFHGLALHVLEDSDHFPPPSFCSPSSFVSHMTESELPSPSGFSPLTVAFIPLKLSFPDLTTQLQACREK